MTDIDGGDLHALILAGGLSRRLGGVAKAGLMLEEQTLLARTVDAAACVIAAHRTTASGAGQGDGGIAVVGPVEKIAGWLATAKHCGQAVAVQENPPYCGPAAGIAAGTGALAGESGHVLVLACDMPHAGEVARFLVAKLADCSPGEGVMAVAAGKQQPLAAIYPLAELRAAADAARASHRLENASVFSLIARLNMLEVAVPAQLTADIDTWADARSQGIAAGPPAAEG
ncbi:molybdopterin-guanine dinucleotide biosynthesis protein A [Arthrobacter sp. UYCu511]|uniref:NTP transferase domain-containing protein n=1 Tax=Arthrobacter sp. UYCu511 TaxID=3156337 RepID=UPI003393AF69